MSSSNQIKSPTNCDAHLAEGLFQTHSGNTVKEIRTGIKIVKIRKLSGFFYKGNVKKL
ncbi:MULTISPECIES: DUF6783 domain-containing protein [Clostridia]|uniref:DUF6783 domain-containing protein n=1 Tax=Clostridia TaxID=186801 RepID=UPI003A7F1F40